MLQCDPALPTVVRYTGEICVQYPTLQLLSREMLAERSPIIGTPISRTASERHRASRSRCEDIDSVEENTRRQGTEQESKNWVLPKGFEHVTHLPFSQSERSPGLRIEAVSFACERQRSDSQPPRPPTRLSPDCSPSLQGQRDAPPRLRGARVSRTRSSSAPSTSTTSTSGESTPSSLIGRPTSSPRVRPSVSTTRF